MNSTSFVLPAHISGFKNPDAPALAMLSADDLQNYCEVACEAQGYTVIQFINLNHQKDRTYHLCHIQKGNFEGLIFLNKYHKVIAFSKLEETLPSSYDGSTEMPRNAYTDLEDLNQAFSKYFMVLPVNILLMPLDSDIPESAEVVKQLKDVEFGEFSYWVPKNIGQVVFNGWEKDS